MNFKMRCVVALVPLALAALPALAMGPVDGEVGALYWANDFEAAEGGSSLSSDAGAPGYRAEIWFFKKYGLRAAHYASELDDFNDLSSDYTSVDFMWRAFSPTENNFLAIGLGWQTMDLETIGLEGDTSGVRVDVEGRVALGGLFYLYGQGSYLPSLDDAPAVDPLLGNFEDLDGHEFEAGVSWKIAPFLSLRAGYREQVINFTRTDFIPLPGEDSEVAGDATTEGFLLGLSVRF